MDLINNLPNNWKHDAILVTTPGRDDRGDVTPGSKQRISGCLLAINESSDLDNLNAAPTVRARLFIPKVVTVKSTDQVETLSPAPVVGRWSVDGPAINWPMGTEVRLEWEGDANGES